MKIAVVGLGYVGLSISVLLSRITSVCALDIDEERVSLINDKISPISDPEIQAYLQGKDSLDLQATIDTPTALKDADFVVVATPTNYDPDLNRFDTSSVLDVVQKVRTHSPHSTVVIKSTVPVGFTTNLHASFPDLDIVFSPEFLREGKALHDNLHPSRIVIGGKSEKAIKFGNLLKDAALSTQTPVIVTSPTEAEAIKLFANTFLAMRVAYFNELDTYACRYGLNSRDIIDGVCLDPRIGNYYNNPSFGYGGYCLPKDTKQLLANFSGIPQTLIRAIVESNVIRKNFIASEILSHNPKVVGVYRLVMKTGSDNFRESSVQDIVGQLEAAGVEIVIYEPTLSEDKRNGHKVYSNIQEFFADTDIIIANRWHKELSPVEKKVFSRDLFGNN